MLIPIGTVYGAAGTGQMTDIKGHWAEADIQEWLDKGLVTGYPDHTFRPEQVVARGEFVALVNRAFQFTEAKSIQYKDLKEGTWVFAEVQKAIAQGYISGFSDNTFRPKLTITRQETAVMLTRILKLPNDDTNNVITVKDSSALPAWSKDAIQLALAHGIMSLNEDGTFQPQRAMTRAESVVVIKKALTLNPVYYKTAGTYGNSVVSTVYNPVVIQSSDVTLKNVHIKGDLTISSEVGDGNVYLDGVQVDGVTRIEGGGKNSIHFNNSMLGIVIVDRASNIVRIVSEGTTVIQDTQIVGSAILEELGSAGDGFINVTVLPQRSGAGERELSIAGSVNQFTVNGNVGNLTFVSGTIVRMTVSGQLVIKKFTLQKAVTIQNLDLNSTTTIVGDGKIDNVKLADAAKDSVLPGQSAPVMGGFFGGGFPVGGGGGNSEPAAITSISAVNGTIDVIFDKSLSSAPPASDFAVFQKIDNGNEQRIESSRVELLDNKTTVRLTVPAVQGHEDNSQDVVYSLSYKGASTVTAPKVTVSKSTSTVTGRLMYKRYEFPNPFPVYMVAIKLEGINGTAGTYSNRTDQQGQFTFNHVAAGNYAFNVYAENIRVCSCGTFTVETGKDLNTDDIVIEESAPQPDIKETTFADTGYIEGMVSGLNGPFQIKVELADGTKLRTPNGKYGMFFGFNLMDYNPDLVLHANDKLYLTVYSDGGWSGERIEINVLERTRTNPPTVTSAVYDGESIYIHGTVEALNNSETNISVRTLNGPSIGWWTGGGGPFEMSLFNSPKLNVGDQLLVHAQGQDQGRSTPVLITVSAPTVTTGQPSISADILEDDDSIRVIAEKDSRIVITRADGTVIGQGTAYDDYGTYNNITLNSAPIAGETLYLTAKSREKLLSDPLPIVVKNRPVTPTPEIRGAVYSDSYVTVYSLPYADLFLKDMQGDIITSAYTYSEGMNEFWNVELTTGMQYQVTAKLYGMKESEPVIFTAVAPTEKTPIPSVSASVYADRDYVFSGVTLPHADVYFYYEDGTLIYSNRADEQGTFYLSMPGNPAVKPGDKIMIKADAAGKVLSDPLEITTISPVERTSQPSVNNISNIYGYNNTISGFASKKSFLEVFRDDGSPIGAGYADMNDGHWEIWIQAIIRGGERIYIISDEVGKLPSDSVYITIQQSPQSAPPVLTSAVTAQSTTIEGTYSQPGALIYVATEKDEWITGDMVNEDGSFSIQLYQTFEPGRMIKVYAFEKQKEASNPIIIVIA